MRLRPDHLQQIVKALTPFIEPVDATLYLFGSRTKDDQRGGDIDLALVFTHETTFQTLKQNKYKLLSSIHSLLGERKIDLRLGLAPTCLQDPFFQIIMVDAIEIYRWLPAVPKRSLPI